MTRVPCPVARSTTRRAWHGDATVVDPPEEAADTARVGVAFDVVEAVDHVHRFRGGAIDHFAGREAARHGASAVE
jgi:hypothetical protein